MPAEISDCVWSLAAQALGQHHGGGGRGIGPAQHRRQQRVAAEVAVALQQIAQIRQRADGHHRQPDAERRERRQRGDARIGNQRQDDADQDEEFAGGQQFVARHHMDEPVQPLARAEQQHCRHGERDRHPGRLHHGDRPDHIGEQVGGRDHEARRFRLARRRAQIGVQPGGEREQPGDKGQRMRRLDQIERRPAHREHGKGAHPARARALLALVDLLEGQPHEHGKPDGERQPSGQFQWCQSGHAGSGVPRTISAY